MPIDDDEARDLLAQLEREIKGSGDDEVPESLCFMHTGMAHGIMFALKRCGSEWARKESEEMWKAEEDRRRGISR